MRCNESEEAARYNRLIAARLRVLRYDRGKSQQDVAAALGITYQQLQKYENAQNRLSAGRLFHLCDVLEVDILDIQAGFHD